MKTFLKGINLPPFRPHRHRNWSNLTLGLIDIQKSSSDLKLLWFDPVRAVESCVLAAELIGRSLQGIITEYEGKTADVGCKTLFSGDSPR
jgi:hypothetical protein